MVNLESVPRQGDALIIVPPFAGLDRPALGPHVLQSCAREGGFRVNVLYANLLFAAAIGERLYQAICYGPYSPLIGERLFAAAAHGDKRLGRLGRLGNSHDGSLKLSAGNITVDLGLLEIQRIEALAVQWVDDLAEAILALDFPVVGCSTTYQQTSASVALLRRIKSWRPEIVTIMGGGNCEGEMAEGILLLRPGIDFVFSGELDCRTFQ